MSYFSAIKRVEKCFAEVADVNLHKNMNFDSNCIFSETQKFVDLGLSPAHTEDKLKSILDPATRAGGLTDIFNGITYSHGIAKLHRTE